MCATEGQVLWQGDLAQDAGPDYHLALAIHVGLRYHHFVAQRHRFGLQPKLQMSDPRLRKNVVGPDCAD